MNKIIMIMLTAIMFTGCSVIPKDPRMSVGKKCDVRDGSTVSSYIWIYGKEGGLTASKEQSEE